MPPQAIKFGNYLLLERLAIGGMAEVYLGKSADSAAGGNLVAVKRILPTIAEDSEFVAMFIDEAKIAGQLNHTNIARIFDLGKIHSSYYIVMEYVPGPDLRTIWDLGYDLGGLPMEMVCHSVIKLCEGLDYAHRRRDNRGRPLNIIHRDISPQNILISFDGDVKIIDFGIAKAVGRVVRTQTGILKGKFAYMAPEQARGEAIDHRVDIFAAGVILYELCTGQRLYKADSDFMLLDKVRRVDIIPPSEIRAELAGEMERIILKALAPKVEDRYPWASALQADLERYMVSHNLVFRREQVSEFIRTKFAEDYSLELERFEEYATVEPPVASSEDERSEQSAEIAMSLASRTHSGSVVPDDITVVNPSPFEDDPDDSLLSEDSNPLFPSMDSLERSSSAPTEIGGYPQFAESQSSETNEDTETNPTDEQTEASDLASYDEATLAADQVAQAAQAAQAAQVAQVADGVAAEISRSSPSLPSSEATEADSLPFAEEGDSLLTPDMTGGRRPQVEIDPAVRNSAGYTNQGRKTAPERPEIIPPLPVPEVEPPEVEPPEAVPEPVQPMPASQPESSYPGFKEAYIETSTVQRDTVEPDLEEFGLGRGTRWLRIGLAFAAGVVSAILGTVLFLNVVAEETGHLVVVVEPRETEVLIDDVSTGVTAPIWRALPPGDHKVTFKKVGVPDLERTVSISEGQVAFLDETMPRGKGSLKITSDPEGATVTIGDNEVGVTPTLVPDLEEDKTYSVELNHKLTKKMVEEVEIEPGKTKPLHLTLVYRYSQVNVRPVPEDAVVYWDNRWRRKKTIAKVALGSGHQLRVVRPGCDPFEQEVTPEGEKEIDVAPDLTCGSFDSGGTLTLTGSRRGRVMIGDVDLGWLPLNKYALPAGTYSVVVRGRRTTSKMDIKITSGADVVQQVKVR